MVLQTETYGLKIKRIERTCFGCPSQWVGKLEDDRVVYVRYRWGILSVGIGDDIEEATKRIVYKLPYGDMHDGVINLNEVLDLTGMVM